MEVAYEASNHYPKGRAYDHTAGHTRRLDTGRLYMLSELQQKYWIPSANSALRNFLSGCIIRWNAKGKPLEQTGQEDRLPPDELPVTNVGPLWTADLKQGFSTVKRYAAYLSYNLHNFNVHTINTDSCLNGIRCFFFMQKRSGCVMWSETARLLLNRSKTIQE